MSNYDDELYGLVSPGALDLHAVIDRAVRILHKEPRTAVQILSDLGDCFGAFETVDLSPSWAPGQLAIEGCLDPKNMKRAGELLIELAQRYEPQTEDE